MYFNKNNHIDKEKLNNIILKLQEFMGDKEILLTSWREERKDNNEEYTEEFENIIYEGLVDKLAKDIEDVRRFPIHGVSQTQYEKIKNLQNVVLNILESSTYKKYEDLI